MSCRYVAMISLPSWPRAAIRMDLVGGGSLFTYRMGRFQVCTDLNCIIRSIICANGGIVLNSIRIIYAGTRNGLCEIWGTLITKDDTYVREIEYEMSGNIAE